MTYCIACQANVDAFQDIDARGRVVNACPTCGQVLSEVAGATGRCGGSAPTLPLVAPLDGVGPNEGRRGSAPALAGPDPDDVVELAKTRLAAIEAQLAVLSKLEREAGRLRRLIAAAEDDSEPLNGVASNASVGAQPLP